MAIQLKKGENLLQEIADVWYNSEERVNTFLKFTLREDVGNLLVTDHGLIFKGIDINFRVSHISDITRKKIKMKPGSGAGYIEVACYDEQGAKKRIYFLAGALAVWDMAKKTDKLYTYLLNWLDTNPQVMSQQAQSQLPTPPALKIQLCPRCRSELEYIEQYDRWYCYNCGTYT